MTGHDDDLTPWLDDPVVQALRGPGTPEELGGEADYVSAFRAARTTAPLPTGRDRLRRAGRRLGGGGTAVVVAVALGAGAAAAYTQNLPDPVQRAVHGVLGPVGVPGPATTPPGRSSGAGQSPAPTSTAPSPTGSSDGAPTEQPTDETTEQPSDRPTEDPSPTPSSSPTETPTSSPTDSPTASPTESPTEIPTVPASSVELSGTSHRAGPDEQVPLSGVVTATDTTPVPGEQVALLQRHGRTWLPVASTVSDENGAVSLTTPALARTSVFRLAVGEDLTSAPWRIVLVPTVDMVARPGSTATEIVVTAIGGQPGDPVALHVRRPDGLVLVGRSRLADDLTASFSVASPAERVTYVAQLSRSRAHASARDALRLRPLEPQVLSASVPDDTPGPRDAVTVSGTVSGVDGIVLPGRRVWLLLREPGQEWRRVGSATSDSAGTVRIPVGPIDRSVAVRLRIGQVRSPSVALRLQPEWSTSVSPSGDGTAVIAGTALGGTPGDTVLLRTMVAGRLTTVQQATLAPGGAVRFDVLLPQARQDRYRLVLPRTPWHLRAITAVVVKAGV